METRIKTYGLIIGILLFVALLAGLSYAYYSTGTSDVGSISGSAGCFTIDYDKGNNINGDLLLLDEDDIISGNMITIGNGMQLTYVNAGINSACTIDGYLAIKLNVSTLSDGFISGDSVGALKYVVAEYSISSYSSVSVSSLNNNAFNILKSGSITSLGEQTIYTDSLSKGSKNGYLIIFYIDGELANNDVGNSSFSANVSAVATQGERPLDAAEYITSLYTDADKSTVENNEITYNYASSVNLMNDRLGGTTSSLDGGNVRYYGTNLNNYIYFNCEEYPDTNCQLWRIIGVFDGKLKIIKASTIGTYSWDTSASSSLGINEWSQADVMKLLNPGYESETVGGSLYYNSASGSCYTNSNNGTSSCDFTDIGIKNDETRNKIATVNWNTGGISSANIYSNVAYTNERGETVKTNISDGVTRQTSWSGKIALAYPSDYGYAADFNNCTSQLSGYSSCTSYNWIYKITGKVTDLMTPSSASNDIFYIAGNGDVSVEESMPSGFMGITKNIVPTLYLNPTERLVGGIGSSSDPYRLE